MQSSKQLVFQSRSGRASLTSLLALGFFSAVACSSGESPGPAASAGSATTAGAGAATTAGTGGNVAAGAPGSAGSTAIAGGGQAGSTNGGGGNSSGGTTGGTSGGVAAGGASGSVGMAGTSGGGGGAAGGANNAPFALTSSAFKEGEQVPLMYKCSNVNPAGQNMSPPLSWGPGPAGTKSYAIVLNHVPTPEHWVLWDIPASVTSLAADIEHKAAPAVPAGSKQSLANLDGFNGSGYLGPCPQMANAVQTYVFTLYALDVDTVPGLSATSTPGDAATAVKAHLVAGSKGVTLSGTQIRTN